MDRQAAAPDGPPRDAQIVQEEPSLPRASGLHGNRFLDEKLQFEVTKPTAWVFIDPAFEREVRDWMSLGSAQVDEQFRSSTRIPLITIAKNTTTSADVSPSVTVWARPLGRLKGLEPREAAAVVLSQMQQAIPSFVSEGAADQVLVGNLEAGHFEGRFDIQWFDGTTSHVVTRVWLVPRGNDVFIIGMTSPLPVAPETASDFSQILSSLRFAKPRRTSP